MSRRTLTLSVIKCLIPLGMLCSIPALAQAPAQGGAPRGAAARDLPPVPPPPLFFREQWQQTPEQKGGAASGEAGVMQKNVGGSNLQLELYGPSSNQIQATGIPGNKGNPMHVWTGLCTTPCGVALRDKDNYVDLTNLASIKWNTKVSGMHRIRPMVKLADGTLLVGNRTSGTTIGWFESEIPLKGMKWLRLDPEKLVTKGNWVENPDLSKVDEVGFVDLMPGSGHGPGGWSDVAQMEVYGKPVPRK